MTTGKAPDDPEDRTKRILGCSRCERTVVCSAEEVGIYMRGGWPKCCGETMTLFIQANLPGKANP
jgi:hypothetical protein